ncbi:uncharacterized protein L203_102952 [Cryptococcus depauperatus CBS 7841]|uniref:Uncharacterized protein n=1 Tax=Cryptococcus depauperatus CBS 7841 TaxID=1295531 RepID=A0AAJ8JSP1_9TREE
MDGTLTNSILTLSLCGLIMSVLVANYIRRGFEATMTDSSTSQNRRETSLDALLLSRSGGDAILAYTPSLYISESNCNSLQSSL